jgi:hypothetical protein
MEESYERQLESALAAFPDEGCLVALVATIELDQAAALASDLAQVIGRSRTGHTLLVAIEDAPPALDHEIGVEGGAGLTEVLAGTKTVSQVAAHGRARGFIFVPAGDSPGPAVDVLGSRALRALATTVGGRGGAMLLFLPIEALDSAAPPTVDGVVWLGPEPDREAVPDGWRTLGTLLPPGFTAPARPSVASSPRVASTPAPIKISGPRHGPDARKSKAVRRPFAAALLTAAVVFATALTVFVLARSRGPDSFIPENDSLWLQNRLTETADSTP